MSISIVPVHPFVLKDIEFVVIESDFAAHLSQVQFKPERQTVTWQGGTPSASFSDSAAPSWSCEIAYAQDWEAAGSFSRWCLAHDGETFDVKFKPKRGTGLPAFLATVIVASGPIGGAIGEVQVGTVTFGCSGAPVPDYDDDGGTTPNPAEPPTNP